MDDGSCTCPAVVVSHAHDRNGCYPGVKCNSRRLLDRSRFDFSQPCGTEHGESAADHRFSVSAVSTPAHPRPAGYQPQSSSIPGASADEIQAAASRQLHVQLLVPLARRVLRISGSRYR